jgi:chaperonin GroEL
MLWGSKTLSKLARYVTADDELQKQIASGLDKAYQVAAAAYGPSAGNVLIEQNYGDPLLSRDGVTNLKRLYLNDPVENMAVRTLVQASSQNNKKAGDGTTAVVILAYHLYQEARKLVAAGYNRMAVKRMLEQTSVSVIEQLQAMSRPVTPELMQRVCQISAGDDAIGQMIADVINEVGAAGGVTVESYPGVGIFSDLVDGFYFRSGFTHLALASDPTNLVSEHKDVPILLIERPLQTVSDIAPVLDKIAGTGIRELVLVGDCSPEVLEMLLRNRMGGVISVTPVKPPVHEGALSLFLDDLALVAGAKIVVPGSDFDITMLGYAERITVDEFSTTIIGGDGTTEDIAARAEELKRQLFESTSEVTTQALRDRIGRLTGKIAIIRVGGATEVEQKEVKLRVEDAICAGQAALRDGVVSGGGVALARVTVDNFKSAFKQPFLQLANNAGLNGDGLLGEVEKAKAWHGFNLKRPTDKPVDLLKEGVLDPSLVVQETVLNATSVVGSLITSTVALTFVDREVKGD